jgi:hypothetical protein
VIVCHAYVPDVYKEIRGLLSSQLDGHVDSVGQDQVLTALQEKGVIQDLLRLAGQPPPAGAPPAGSGALTSHSAAPSLIAPRLVPGRRYLHFKLHGGRAFVESLIDEDIQHTPSTLTLCLHFRSQRFRSQPVAFTVEPQFNDSFYIDLQVNTNVLSCCGWSLLQHMRLSALILLPLDPQISPTFSPSPPISPQTAQSCSRGASRGFGGNE